jgi:hypothetical protein
MGFLLFVLFICMGFAVSPVFFWLALALLVLSVLAS